MCRLLDELGLEPWSYRGDPKQQVQQEIEIIRGVQKKKVICILDEVPVLAGQNKLWENKLKLQRIDIYCILPHMDRSETEQSIRSHLDYAGCTQKIVHGEGGE